jgi:O-acetylserine/cysteine efflux transporter
MNADRRRAVAALTAAGLAWGITVPLSKVALGWLAPGWLTFARFGLAAAVLLPAASRRGLLAAWTPRVLAAGALGYGGSVVLQNAGITRTSVTHAALLIGATPVLVAIIAALWHRTVARPVAWAGFAVSLAGAALITGGRGGGATTGGDALVLASLLLSASVTVAQGRLLQGRDPVAVTAVQFLGAALAVLPFAVATEGLPAAPAGHGAVLALAGLAACGTLLPFTLFAYGQSRVSAELAGAFLNLEPLVGAAAGAVFFANPVGLAQVTGGAAIIAGIALSSLPLLSGDRHRPEPPAVRQSRLRTVRGQATAKPASGTRIPERERALTPRLPGGGRPAATASLRTHKQVITRPPSRAKRGGQRRDRPPNFRASHPKRTARSGPHGRQLQPARRDRRARLHPGHWPGCPWQGQEAVNSGAGTCTFTGHEFTSS